MFGSSVITTIFVIFVIAFAAYYAAMYVFFITPYKKSVYAYDKKTPWISVLFNKGLMGEYKIAHALEKIPGCRKILYNVYVPLGEVYEDKNGKTHEAYTEIDLLVIHERGIFVIESKRYQGWIFGNDKQCKWTASYKNGSKQQFRSPLMQNENHIKALRSWMQTKYCAQFNASTIPYINLVIFSGECELKKVSVSKEDCFVTRLENLPTIYAKITNSNRCPKVFTPEQVVQLYQDIHALTKVTAEEKRAHIERVLEIKNQNKKGKLPG